YEEALRNTCHPPVEAGLESSGRETGRPRYFPATTAGKASGSRRPAFSWPGQTRDAKRARRGSPFRCPARAPWRRPRRSGPVRRRAPSRACRTGRAPRRRRSARRRPAPARRTGRAAAAARSPGSPRGWFGRAGSSPSARPSRDPSQGFLPGRKAGIPSPLSKKGFRWAPFGDSQIAGSTNFSAKERPRRGSERSRVSSECMFRARSLPWPILLTWGLAVIGASCRPRPEAAPGIVPVPPPISAPSAPSSPTPSISVVLPTGDAELEAAIRGGSFFRWVARSDSERAGRPVPRVTLGVSPDARADVRVEVARLPAPERFAALAADLP